MGANHTRGSEKIVPDDRRSVDSAMIPGVSGAKLVTLEVSLSLRMRCDDGIKFWLNIAKVLHAIKHEFQTSMAVQVFKPSDPNRQTKEVLGIKFIVGTDDEEGLDCILSNWAKQLQCALIDNSTNLEIDDPMDCIVGEQESEIAVMAELGDCFPPSETIWSDWNSLYTLREFTFSGLGQSEFDYVNYVDYIDYGDCYFLY